MIINMINKMAVCGKTESKANFHPIFRSMIAS